MANGNQDELDRVLDAALAKYAAEPRAGLEERVLANLRAERTRGAERAWWRWGVLAAVATLAIIAVALNWKPDGRAHPGTRVAATTPTTQPARTQVATNREQRGVRSRLAGTARKATRHVSIPITVSARPKLDQFPAPQPLSEQEQALARYVSQFPQEAALIARAQAEYEKEMQQMMKGTSSETEGYDSDQKER